MNLNRAARVSSRALHLPPPPAAPASRSHRQSAWVFKPAPACPSSFRPGCCVGGIVATARNTVSELPRRRRPSYPSPVVPPELENSRAVLENAPTYWCHVMSSAHDRCRHHTRTCYSAHAPCQSSSRARSPTAASVHSALSLAADSSARVQPAVRPCVAHRRTQCFGVSAVWLTVGVERWRVAEDTTMSAVKRISRLGSPPWQTSVRTASRPQGASSLAHPTHVGVTGCCTRTQPQRVCRLGSVCSDGVGLRRDGRGRRCTSHRIRSCSACTIRTTSPRARPTWGRRVTCCGGDTSAATSAARR